MNKYLGSVLAAILGGVITLFGAYQMGWGETKYVRTADDPVVQFSNLTTPTDAELVPVSGFTTAAEKALPGVVHIKAASRVNGSQSGEIPEMFRDFFGPGFGDEYKDNGGGREAPLQQGSGSGVIISADGYIVTNNHVVEGAEQLEVVLNDQRTYEATIIGTDETTDVALIKIEADGLPVVQFANSDQVRIGEWVIAVGNPFSLTNTVTAGIVSAKGRSIDILRQRSQYAIESFIQTDAVVNPGNSGGALVNTNGDLIGINTAISSPTGVFAGYSFAVPSNIVAKVVEDLREYGEVQRGYLGARIVELNSALAREQGIDRDNGVYIAGVNEGSAADEAGLQEGDVVIAVDGTPTLRNSELLEQLGLRRPGEEVNLTIERDGREMGLTAVLKGSTGSSEVVLASTDEPLQELGAELEPLDRQAANRLGVDGGLRITNLETGLISETTRIREGFVITSADGRQVSTVKDLEEIIRDQQDGSVLLEGVYPESGKRVNYGLSLVAPGE
ncbi:MAG: Do family serine endopeptidase [Bacteroidota bacterium]